MIIQNNRLKAYLKNVLFLSGAPCDGKTALSQALAEKHGLEVYHAHERPDVMVQELIRLSQKQVVLCDCRLTEEEARRLTDPSRIVFLPDDPTEELLSQVEHQFGLAARPITIHKVDRDTDLSRNLIEFVENFSWEEVKEHTLQSLRRWDFTDWETPFVAMSGDRVVGMISLLKTDYYPLPEIFPWVTTLFVTEVYRGRRISQKLIDHANAYAKELGFDRTYIPSAHVGLYEKYGYHYLKDIVNYGGDTDRLYVKELR